MFDRSWVQDSAQKPAIALCS